MAEPKGILTFGNISCFGVNQVGVPEAALIAHLCPSVQVSVVDLDPEKITLWNTKQITSREPKVEEMLKKSQNRNLIFTTNTVAAVKEAEIIFICFDTSHHSEGVKEKALDVSDIEKAIRIIANESETNKIIAVKSTVPVGTSQFLQRVLLANKQANVNLQVLSVPEFFSAGNSISSLLHPEKIIIGSDLSKGALTASNALTSFYTPWIPRNKILTMSSQSAELAVITQNAFLAQKVSDVSALSIVCEQFYGDITEVIGVLEECVEISWIDAEPSLGFRGSHLKRDLTYLVEMCEELNLRETADYWRQVLIMNEHLEKRFFRKVISTFFNTLVHRKIAIWGLAFQKNAEIPQDSLAVAICQNLIKEGAKLTVCDPKVECRLVMNELKEAGLDKAVTYCDDPYKASRKTDAIIILSDWEDLKGLDYNLIYKDMLRPAHIFDGRSCLPREELTKIGFIVNSVGKKMQKTFPYL